MCSSLEKGMQRMIMCVMQSLEHNESPSKWSTRDPNLTVRRVLKRLNIDPLEVPKILIVNEEDTSTI
jgi:hypothetical protein